MRLFYQALLSAFIGVCILAGTAQADCCNAGFSSYHLSQSYGLNTFQFSMHDSAAADMQFAQWGFGDGTYSTEKNPAHSFLCAGDYSVTLTVFKLMVDGVQRSCTETHVVSVKSACSDFILFKSGRQISFQQIAAFDLDSTAAWVSDRTFIWTFGDGQTSNMLHPIHTYAQEGNYTVCLYQNRKDSAFVDSCYSCRTVIVQDTSQVASCNAVFTYAVTGSNVTVHAADSLHASRWWVHGDTGAYYGKDADFSVTPNGNITICHRQYTAAESDSNYCEACTTIYSNVPRDSTRSACQSNFDYALIGDSVVTLNRIDSAYISLWWFQINGVDTGGRYYGGDTSMFMPPTGEVSVCHLQHNDYYSKAAMDSCIVCKIVRSETDSVVPVQVCYSNFNYTVVGNTVSVYLDSISNGSHHWRFENEAIRYDTSITSYTFNSPGTKRICQTTMATNYSTNVTDSCTTCKDVLIETAHVSIHPNPAANHINIRVENGLLSSISIYDINGTQVKNSNDLNVDRYTINVSNLTRGIYYVSTTLLDGRITKSKIIVL